MCNKVTYKYGGIKKDAVKTQYSKSIEKPFVWNGFSEGLTGIHIAFLTAIERIREKQRFALK